MAIIVQCTGPDGFNATHTYENGWTVAVKDNGALAVLHRDNSTLGAYPASNWNSAYDTSHVAIS
ncbi:hypothetical protein GS921_13410 [Rhodococcus hoagii]|nr:hypothetical protein [Prescottella equi]